MFVVHDVLLDVAFGVARPRLVSLASSPALVDASRAAYEEGLDSLIQTGPTLAEAAGPRLARVKFLPPVDRPGTTTVGLRWEASGAATGLFPVLDADITLAVASEHTTTLTLSGVYRPVSDGEALNGAALNGAAPLGAQVPDETAPGQVADVVVRSLLRYAAAYLSQQATDLTQ
jgi:hypothetical protein